MPAYSLAQVLESRRCGKRPRTVTRFQVIAATFSNSMPWTPTVTAGVGAFGSVSAVGDYRQLGKVVYFSLRITITDVGTASGYISVSLPLLAANSGRFQFAGGRETQLTAVSINGAIQPNTHTMYVSKYDGSFIGGSGQTLDLSGQYEIA